MTTADDDETQTGCRLPYLLLIRQRLAGGSGLPAVDILHCSKDTPTHVRLEPQGFVLLGEGIFKLLLKLATQNKKTPKKFPSISTGFAGKFSVTDGTPAFFTVTFHRVVFQLSLTCQNLVTAL